MLVIRSPLRGREVALNGLTRQGSPFRWLKPTRVSWATVYILTSRNFGHEYWKTSLGDANAAIVTRT